MFAVAIKNDAILIKCWCSSGTQVVLYAFVSTYKLQTAQGGVFTLAAFYLLFFYNFLWTALLIQFGIDVTSFNSNIASKICGVIMEAYLLTK